MVVELLSAKWHDSRDSQKSWQAGVIDVADSKNSHSASLMHSLCPAIQAEYGVCLIVTNLLRSYCTMPYA